MKVNGNGLMELNCLGIQTGKVINQPNNYNNQDCGAIIEGWRGWHYYDATWFDDSCSEAKGFICEKI